MEYPKEIAERFITETRENYRKGVETNRRAKRIIRDKKPYRQLGYKTPEGKIQSVYDYYNPSAPEGCEIGVVTVHPNLKFYANGTYGYEYAYSDFTLIKDVDLSVESVIKA